METRNFNAKSGLMDAIRYFSDPMVCLETVRDAKWPNGPICPRCDGKKVSFIKTRMLWTCLGCRKQFSVKVGTIFEDSAVPLDKWMVAMWMLANCKNGISSYEVAKAIKVTQRTGWFMLQRIRKVMQNGSLMKIGGEGEEVEVDETYIGGKARFMHRGRRLRALGSGKRGRFMGKVAVQGLLDRHGEIRTRVVGDEAKRDVLMAGIREHVEPGTNVYTDNAVMYDPLDAQGYVHQVVNHAEKYVDGKVHTNGLENFWSLLKRGLKGTYVSVEPFHLFRYVDEQAFRFNERKATDAERFATVLCSIGGKRLTYAQVRGCR
jgi:transposase-like protein